MMIKSPAIVKHTIGGGTSNIVSMDMEAALELIGLDTPNDLELDYAGRLITKIVAQFPPSFEGRSSRERSEIVHQAVRPA
jgi:hypothetical protein